jgi:hypothetical protein
MIHVKKFARKVERNSGWVGAVPFGASNVQDSPMRRAYLLSVGKANQAALSIVGLIHLFDN